MNKYVDIEQIKEVIRTEWVKYMPSDLDINLSFVLGKIAEVPTIEVSEDCISRKWLEENAEFYSQGLYDESAWAVPLSILDDAPSVVQSRAEGEWIPRYHQGVDKLICECSNCHTLHAITNFCPDCGEKMKGAEK